MLPDPDWKAEDQKVQVRTSVGKNNEDDKQGSDMPIWMFKEESDRMETKKRDSRRMVTVLHKRSKTKRPLWRESVLLYQF